MHGNGVWAAGVRAIPRFLSLEYIDGFAPAFED